MSHNNINLPLVSVGIPMFNAENTIEAAVESVYRQTYNNWELIICDNASTDESLGRLRKFVKQDKRIKIFTNDVNQGAMNNFNKCFMNSSGKYFTWLAADDTKERNFLEDTIAILESDSKIGLVFPSSMVILASAELPIYRYKAENYKTNPGKISQFNFAMKHFPAVGLFGTYRASLVSKTGLFRNFVGGDLLFAHELSLIGEIVGFNKTLVNYRLRDTWNTREQDELTYLARKGQDPSSLKKFSMYIDLIYRHSDSKSQKFAFMLILVRHAIKNRIHWMLRKLIKVVSTILTSSVLINLISRQLISYRFYEIQDLSLFNSRIRNPILGIDKP